MFNRRGLRPFPMNNAFQDGMIDIDNNSGNIDIDFAQQQQQVNNQSTAGGYQTNMISNPIMEPIRERVVQRTIMHEVPQDCRHLVIQGGISFVNVY